MVDDRPAVGGNVHPPDHDPKQGAAPRDPATGGYGPLPAIPGFKTCCVRRRGVIRQQVDLRKGFYARNFVDVLHGRAAFEDSHRIQVRLQNGGVRTFIARTDIVIATGARPYHPQDVDFSHPRILGQRLDPGAEGPSPVGYDIWRGA